MTKTLGIVALVLALGLISLVLRSRATAAWESTVADDDIYYLPPNAWLRFGVVGFNEAAADLIWSKSIVYFSEAPKIRLSRSKMKIAPRKSSDKNPGRPMNYFVRYIDAVSYLDPWFEAPYSEGARLALYHEGVISRSTVETAIEILEKGLKKFPDSGAMLFNLGFTYYYEMGPFFRDESEKKRFQSEGTQMIQRSSLLPDAPALAARLASSLLDRLAMQELIIAHLENQLAAETDPDIREVLIRDLTRLIGQAAKGDSERLQWLWTQWKTTIPWISFELYTLLRGASDTMEMNPEMSPSDEDPES